MKKRIILVMISILIGNYAVPLIAQKIKKNYDQNEIQKTLKQESKLLCDYPEFPLTLLYHPINSSDYMTNINTLIPDSQVNENIDINGTYQGWCSIAADSSGNFIITWVDQRNGALDVYAQRYSSDVITLGSNFQVNDIQSYGSPWVMPTIAVDKSGNFIITWTDNRNGNEDIYAQRYSSDGKTLGSNFKVSDDQGSARQLNSSITADGSGNFIISWADERNDEQDIYAQRYSSDGTLLGSNFRVDDHIGVGEQSWVTISADDGGNFIITWEDERNGEWYDDIYAQRYASDGTALGSNFKVNDDQGSTGQFAPSISTGDSGNFIIVWEDDRNPIDDCVWYTDIYAQRYSSDGTALDSNFKVNDDHVCAVQFYPSISADNKGNFVITWQDERNGEYYYDIYAQRYSSNGTAIENNFKVNDDQGIEWQTDPSISVDSNGNFVIVWEDERNGDYDIYAQLYASDGTALDSNFRINDDPVGLIDDKLYQIPTEFVLHQNYPNPFNPSTTIEFSIPKSDYVTLIVYNILGEEITTIVNRKLKAGNYTYKFDGTHFASGIYLYSLEAGEFSDMKKMVILH